MSFGDPIIGTDLAEQELDIAGDLIIDSAGFGSPDVFVGLPAVPMFSPGFGEDYEPDAFVLDMDGTGKVFSDEGGEIVTVGGAMYWVWMGDIVRYKFRVQHVDTGMVYPKIGYCYSASQGDVDQCRVVLGGLVQFALPPCPLGVYDILVHFSMGPHFDALELAQVIFGGLAVDRRIRDFPTYRNRRRLPLRYLTGPIDVDSENVYPAEA